MFNWFHYLSYVLVMSITPGPNNIMSMSTASRLGFRRSYPFNLGVWAGFSVVMLLCTLFCSTLSALVPKIEPFMLLLGAAYMLHLAWKIFRSDTVSEKEGGRGTFVSGLLLQFVNVKIWLAGIVATQTYVLPSFQDDIPRLILFALLQAACGFASTVIWSLFGSLLKTLFSRYARITNTVMALLLVYCVITLFI